MKKNMANQGDSVKVHNYYKYYTCFTRFSRFFPDIISFQHVRHLDVGRC